MDNILAIALAGAAGAVSRYWVTRAVFNWLGTGYPYGTLLVNISGSLLLGFFSILFLQKLAVPEHIAANWELDGEKIAERWWFA